MKKPDYGFDAPKIVLQCFILTILLLLVIVPVIYFIKPYFFIISLIAIIMLITAALSTFYAAVAIILGSRVFKFRERDWLLSLLQIKGNEQILDVGCGRGLLLIAVAKKLLNGKATGIDIWSNEDQTNNSPQTTIKNAQLEQVVDKIELITADARKMPFKDNTFDIIVSSWAIHNIATPEDRKKALEEMERVLKIDGNIAIMDIKNTQEYEAFFKNHNFREIELLGPRYTFGTPTYIVKAKKL